MTGMAQHRKLKMKALSGGMKYYPEILRYCYLHSFDRNDAEDMAQEDVLVRQALGTGGTMLIVLVIPELWRNLNWGAIAIESVSMYTLRHLYCVRLIILSGVDLLLVTLFCVATSAQHRLAARELATQFLLPVNVTACICLTCLFAPKITKSAFPMALCMVFALLWQEIVKNENAYQSISSWTWSLGLICSICYLGICVSLGQQRMEKILETI